MTRRQVLAGLPSSFFERRSRGHRMQHRGWAGGPTPGLYGVDKRPLQGKRGVAVEWRPTVVEGLRGHAWLGMECGRGRCGAL